MSDTSVNPCLDVDVPYVYDTDESLGGASQEWELSPTPDDIDTTLSADECVYDPENGTIITDGMTGCIKGAESGIAIGAHPLIYIRKRIRIRHLTEEQKKRLRKKLNPQ